MTTDEAIRWGGGTQKALARKLGIAQPSVCNWGDRPPRFRQLQIERLSAGYLRADDDVFAPAVNRRDDKAAA